ncbi:MAG TPA: secondary thiamine-phosphate synthase enzyme YjbQ [Tepidisphaeraceae bacterium]|nr:secondary thiamine-phosphate synthase enzyme YjbQ [Tepidisphaeraceae bacterium]
MASIETETVKTHARSEMIDVTERVRKTVTKHRVTDGYVIVYVPHTTAAVTINENADPDVKSDMLKKLQALIPQCEPYYEHAEGNSDSHVKTSSSGTA